MRTTISIKCRVGSLISLSSSLSHTFFHLYAKGLVKLQDLIRAPTAKPMEVLLRQATADTYHEVLKEVKGKEYYNLVIDTRAENMPAFLKGVSR